MENKTITVRKKISNTKYCEDCFFQGFRGTNFDAIPACIVFDKDLETKEATKKEIENHGLENNITYACKCKQCLELKEGEIVG